MVDVTRLDMNQQIVDDEGRPTPYFESIFQQILARTGDESEDFIEDLQDNLDTGISLSANARISALNKQTEDLGRLITNDAKLSGQVDNLRKSINDLAKSIPTRTNLASIKQEIEDLKRSACVKQNLDSIKKDIEELKRSMPVKQNLDTIIKRIENIEKVI